MPLLAFMVWKHIVDQELDPAVDYGRPDGSPYAASHFLRLQSGAMPWHQSFQNHRPEGPDGFRVS
jgi:hypothetical protein